MICFYPIINQSGCVVRAVFAINVSPSPALDVAELPAMYWLTRATSGDEFVTPDDTDAVNGATSEVEIELHTPL
jgi:hypothetical protein